MLNFSFVRFVFILKGSVQKRANFRELDILGKIVTYDFLRRDFNHGGADNGPIIPLFIHVQFVG